MTALEDEAKFHPQNQEYDRMSEELAALLRRRVAARFYDQPHVIDAIARGILRSEELSSST